MVVWQSIGVLVGAFAIFALVEKQVISLDIATSIILLLSAWLIAHLFDAAYWYNRNLAIIANIERQFLLRSDLKEIHYYFGSHRQKNKMIEHLRIQLSLGVALAVLVLLYHFFDRVLPGLTSSFCNFEPVRSLPYVVVLASLFYLRKLKLDGAEKYKEFIDNSPGIEIDTSSVSYGKGHGHSTG